MGGELGERPKQGLVTQTVSKIVMSFAQKVRQHLVSIHLLFRFVEGLMMGAMGLVIQGRR